MNSNSMLSTYASNISISLTAIIRERCFMCCDFGTREDVVLGVIGADVIFDQLYKYLRDNFDPCMDSKDEYSIHDAYFLQLLGLFI